jgi:hypothetical protein
MVVDVKITGISIENARLAIRLVESRSRRT